MSTPQAQGLFVDSKWKIDSFGKTSLFGSCSYISNWSRNLKNHIFDRSPSFPFVRFSHVLDWLLHFCLSARFLCRGIRDPHKGLSYIQLRNPTLKYRAAQPETDLAQWNRSIIQHQKTVFALTLEWQSAIWSSRLRIGDSRIYEYWGLGGVEENWTNFAYGWMALEYHSKPICSPKSFQDL